MMTKLGWLTKLVYLDGKRRRVLRWGIRKAPDLVYDERGRLHIAYRSSPVREATAAEIAEYARTHWGEQGDGDVLAGGEALPPFRVLGPSLSITYTTRKGSAQLTDWFHVWGEGARGKWTPPTVIEHVCRAPKCAGRGAVKLRGGSYHVSDRGIVG
jgi:hypothetical protein